MLAGYARGRAGDFRFVCAGPGGDQLIVCRGGCARSCLSDRVPQESARTFTSGLASACGGDGGLSNPPPVIPRIRLLAGTSYLPASRRRPHPSVPLSVHLSLCLSRGGGKGLRAKRPLTGPVHSACDVRKHYRLYVVNGKANNPPRPVRPCPILGHGSRALTGARRSKHSEHRASAVSTQSIGLRAQSPEHRAWSRVRGLSNLNTSAPQPEAQSSERQVSDSCVFALRTCEGPC